MSEPETTRWTLDSYGDGIWSCEKCDLEWCFTDGEPEENKVNYCPVCGRKITEFVRPQAEIDGDDES